MSVYLPSLLLSLAGSFALEHKAKAALHPAYHTTMADPQLAALMAANLKKQRQADEQVVEANGEGSKQPRKKKPLPPGAQQIGMHAMLLQEAARSSIALKPAPKQWGVQQPDLQELKKKTNSTMKEETKEEDTTTSK